MLFLFVAGLVGLLIFPVFKCLSYIWRVLHHVSLGERQTLFLIIAVKKARYLLSQLSLIASVCAYDLGFISQVYSPGN